MAAALGLSQGFLQEGHITPPGAMGHHWQGWGESRTLLLTHSHKLTHAQCSHKLAVCPFSHIHTHTLTLWRP